MVASGSRAVERCDTLKVAPYSDSPDFLFRAYLTDAHMKTMEVVAGWMTEAGMTTRIDAAGNLVGRYEALDPTLISGEGNRDSGGGVNPPPVSPVSTPETKFGAANSGGNLNKDKALMIASHLDSVRDAGAYDGPLGVMLGIEAVAALHETGRRLPFAIEVYGFGDEEGSRFPSAMLTSRAVAGTVAAGALEQFDRDGMSLTEALEMRGLKVTDYLKAARNPSDFIGYFEAHIEQGPVLEAEDLPLGIVTAIAAQARFEAKVSGMAGHAGTTAMGLRRDALVAASEMVLAIEDIATNGPDGLVATVGRMEVGPGAANVVPGKVTFSIDVRAGEAGLRDEAAAKIEAALKTIAALRGVDLSLNRVHELPESPCDASFMGHLETAMSKLGLPARRMVSGAGHDAMIFADMMPTAMLFIRCKGGISHNPFESVRVDDVEAALSVLLGFIDQLEATYP